MQIKGLHHGKQPQNYISIYMKNRMDIINDAVKIQMGKQPVGKNIVFKTFHFIQLIVYRQVGNRITVLDNFIASIYIKKPHG